MYQGYENYPTFTVALWIDKKRGMARMIRSAGESYRIPEEASARFADWLRRTIEMSFKMTGVTAAVEGSDSAASTLLHHAMDEVDWPGLARKYLRDEKEG